MIVLSVVLTAIVTSLVFFKFFRKNEIVEVKKFYLEDVYTRDEAIDEKEFYLRLIYRRKENLALMINDNFPDNFPENVLSIDKDFARINKHFEKEDTQEFILHHGHCHGCSTPIMDKQKTCRDCQFFLFDVRGNNPDLYRKL